MRPRYEARVATMRHRQQGHRPWVLVRVTHGTDDGVPVEFVQVVASYADRDDAIAEAERREGMQEGLRRIGVAVAVWAGMAVARRDPPTPRERVASGMVRVLRTLLADTEADLAAERAARRKWELRLRWRAENSYEQRHPNLDDIDRLYRHEVCAQRDPQKNTERLGSGITRFRWYLDAARRLPIAGPRGVLP